jgi:hypothetical protein
MSGGDAQPTVTWAAVIEDIAAVFFPLVSHEFTVLMELLRKQYHARLGTD